MTMLAIFPTFTESMQDTILNVSATAVGLRNFRQWQLDKNSI